MAQLQAHTVTSFAGMNRKVAGVAKDKSESEICLNWDFGTVGALVKSSGSTIIGAQIASSPVESMFYYSYVSASQQKHRLVCTVSATAYYADLGVASPSFLSATVYTPVVGETTSWAVIDNALYATCATRGHHKSTDGGATYTALSASTNKHHYSTEYRNFLWGAGHDPVTQIDKSEIGGSTAWDTAEFNSTTLASETVEDAVTGIMSQNDQLIIAMASGHMARNNTKEQRTFAKTHHGVKHTNMVATDYFGGWRTNEDIYAYVGHTPQSIGKRVQDLLKSGDSTIMTAFQRSFNAYLNDITVDDIPLTNTLLTYDIDSDAYYMRDDIDVSAATQVVWNGKEYYAYGTSDGYVYVIDPDETKHNGGASSTIKSLYRSVPQYPVDPRFVLRFHEFFIISDNAEGTVLSVSVDGGEFIEIGQIQDDYEQFKDLSEKIPEGHSLRYQLTHAIPDAQPKIELVRFYYEVTDADTK